MTWSEGCPGQVAFIDEIWERGFAFSYGQVLKNMVIQQGGVCCNHAYCSLLWGQNLQNHREADMCRILCSAFQCTALLADEVWVWPAQVGHLGCMMHAACRIMHARCDALLT